VHGSPQEDWPLLVIVPASLRLVWAEELERWLPHLRPAGIHVITGKDDRLCALPEGGRRQQLPQVTITSYEMMKRLTCEACQKGAACSSQQARAQQQWRGGGSGKEEGSGVLQCTGPGRRGRAPGAGFDVNVTCCCMP
jgi:hypothetical protein